MLFYLLIFETKGVISHQPHQRIRLTEIPDLVNKTILAKDVFQSKIFLSVLHLGYMFPYSDYKLHDMGS